MKVVKLVWSGAAHKYPKEGVLVSGQPVIIVIPGEKFNLIYIFSVEEVIE